MSDPTLEQADWCVTNEDRTLNICGTHMKEHSRRSEGDRWCFRHRKRHEFWRVVSMPDGLSYYGPSIKIVGTHSDCSDLFPGWSREWEDDYA